MIARKFAGALRWLSECPHWPSDCSFCSTPEDNFLPLMAEEFKMEMQICHVCVIDLFGQRYDGTLPNIAFIYDESWLGLFAVAPPNPPALESADNLPDRRLWLVV
jgi:hypothetical protein